LWNANQSVTAAQWFYHFFEKAFVSHFRHRVPIFTLRLDRSTISVDALWVGAAHDWNLLHGRELHTAVPGLFLNRCPSHLDEHGEGAVQVRMAVRTDGLLCSSPMKLLTSCAHWWTAI